MLSSSNWLVKPNLARHVTCDSKDFILKYGMNTRNVAKRAVRQLISQAAMKRFNEQGYEATTVEQIASDVGMSIRTYFRYYRAKDDVLLDPTRAFKDKFLEALRVQLSERGIWEALAASLEVTASTCEKVGTIEQTKQLQELVSRTPALLARQLELSEGMMLEATDLCLVESKQAAALGWSTANATVRAAFACLHATRISCGGDIQSTAALTELRRLLDIMAPAKLS